MHGEVEHSLTFDGWCWVFRRGDPFVMTFIVGDDEVSVQKSQICEVGYESMEFALAMAQFMPDQELPSRRQPNHEKYKHYLQIWGCLEYIVYVMIEEVLFNDES